MQITQAEITANGLNPAVCHEDINRHLRWAERTFNDEKEQAIQNIASEKYGGKLGQIALAAISVAEMRLHTAEDEARRDYEWRQQVYGPAHDDSRDVLQERLMNEPGDHSALEHNALGNYLNRVGNRQLAAIMYREEMNVLAGVKPEDEKTMDKDDPGMTVAAVKRMEARHTLASTRAKGLENERRLLSDIYQESLNHEQNLTQADTQSMIAQMHSDTKTAPKTSFAMRAGM